MIQLRGKESLWFGRRICQGSLFRATCSLALLGIGFPSATNAAVMTADGHFGAQTIGNPIGSPWSPVSGSGNSAATTAQSPFTGLFANNNIGANTPVSGANPYFVGGTLATTPANATGVMYLNVDFRNNSAEAGDYSLVVTSGAAAANRTAALYVTGSGLFAESSGGFGSSILSLTTSTWYNAQLALDFTNNSYSGTVTPFGGSSVTITSRSFINENTVNTIYTDGGTSSVGGVAPDHDIDNFALYVPESTLPVGSIVNIDFDGQRPGDASSAGTYFGPGAAGGGNTFNGLAAVSDGTGAGDNITVAGAGLLDDNGGATTVGFSVSPVGGDANPDTPPRSGLDQCGGPVWRLHHQPLGGKRF